MRPDGYAALPPHNQDHQGAKGDVQPVESGQGIEGAGEQIVGEAERKVKYSTI